MIFNFCCITEYILRRRRKNFLYKLLCNMFKIVENEDGSTGVYSIDSGNLICLVPAKRNPVVGNEKVQCEKYSTLRANNVSSSPLPKPIVASVKGAETSNSTSQKGSQILSEIPFDSSSSEYNLRHLTNSKEESTSKKKLALLPLPLECLEDEIEDFSDDCITQDDFLRCVNLISRQNLKSSFPELKNSFPVRKISKISATEPFVSNRGTELVDSADICSPLGKRILQPSQLFVSEETSQTCVLKYDKFCHSLRPSYDDTCNAPQLRCRDNLRKYSVTFKSLKTWPSDFVHIYSFSKRQRLERYKASCSGLSKKGRWLKSLCKKLTVVVKRLSAEEIVEIKKKLKKKNVSLQDTNKNSNISNTINNPVHPMMQTEALSGSSNSSISHECSKNQSETKERVPKLPVSLIAKDCKLTNNLLLPSIHCSLPKAQIVNPFAISTISKPKTNGTFLKLPPGTTCKISSSQLINCNSENKEVTLLGISRLNAKEKAFPSKHSVSESGICLVPLQDVVQKIWKVGDKCYIKGTSIKACGIGELRENFSCMNNVGSASSPNLSHDHAYHRSPATTNPIRPNNREPEYGKREAPIRAVNGNQSDILSENCRKCGLSNGSFLSSSKEKYKALHTNARESSVKLPDQGRNQPLSSHVLISNFNNTGNILNGVKRKNSLSYVHLKGKSNNKQAVRSIPLIDITGDGPEESNLPKPQSSVKWMFHCYGCGFCCTLKSQEEINEMVRKHMRVYHFVTDPAAFLSSYFKNSERAVVTEAFPGYKNNKT